MASEGMAANAGVGVPLCVMTNCYTIVQHQLSSYSRDRDHVGFRPTEKERADHQRRNEAASAGSGRHCSCSNRKCGSQAARTDAERRGRTHPLNQTRGDSRGAVPGVDSAMRSEATSGAGRRYAVVISGSVPWSVTVVPTSPSAQPAVSDQSWKSWEQDTVHNLDQISGRSASSMCARSVDYLDQMTKWPGGTRRGTTRSL